MNCYVERINIDGTFDVYSCPKCDAEIIDPYDCGVNYSYCPYCGQRIEVYEVEDK